MRAGRSRLGMLQRALQLRARTAAIRTRAATPAVSMSDMPKRPRENSETDVLVGGEQPSPPLTRDQRKRREVDERIENYKKQSKAQRRAEYACGANFKTLNDVIQWPLFAKSKHLNLESDGEFAVRADLNAKIGIYRGDITALEVDAIVNAANERCVGGGGVDGAIHRAAGRDLVKECELLGGCPTGKAKATFGYRLPSPCVIHAVGPMGEHPNLLARAYTASLQIAAHNPEIKSIAFPCISTGVFGYPNAKASEVVCHLLRDFLEGPDGAKIDKIVLCLFLDVDERAYCRNLPHFFPNASSV